jgi:hypothetical protein
MKITKQLNIAWIRPEKASIDELVVVHSQPITSAEAGEAWQKFEDGRSIDGLVPIVFLDESLDTPDLRSWLQSRATERITPPKQ